MVNPKITTVLADLVKVNRPILVVMLDILPSQTLTSQLVNTAVINKIIVRAIHVRMAHRTVSAGS